MTENSKTKSPHQKQTPNFSQFTKLYFLGKIISSISKHFVWKLLVLQKEDSAAALLGEGGNGRVQAKLAKKLSHAKLGYAKKSEAKHCSLAVRLQVGEGTGCVAAVLPWASPLHHLHLVLEGELCHLVCAARRCSSASFRWEETWQDKQEVITLHSQWH